MSDRCIFKYPLALSAYQRLLLPKDAQILVVQMQFDTPTMWALADPANDLTHLEVLIEGTGQEHNELYSKHLGTVQHEGMVWHLFTRP